MGNVDVGPKSSRFKLCVWCIDPNNKDIFNLMFISTIYIKMVSIN